MGRAELSDVAGSVGLLMVIEKTVKIALARQENLRGDASVGSDRKRILFVIPSLGGAGGGGAERVAVTLLRHLDRNHLEPHIALVRAEGPFLKDVPADVPIHGLGTRRVRYAVPSFVRVAWKVRPHVVFSTLGYLNLAVICARPFLPKETKLVVKEGSTVSALLAQGVANDRVWSLLYRRLYKRADRVVCSSDHMMNDLAQNFAVPRRKMIRIYNPVDVDLVGRLADAEENPYPTSGPNLVAVGRLSREKGVDLLLDAFALVHKSLAQASLTVLGDGPLAAALREQRDRLGLREFVNFAGFHPNPYPYVKHSDLFVMPSRVEGMPNAVLEALALRKPVVATDCVGAMKEIAGANCRLRLVSSEDPVGLAEGILQVLAETKLGQSLESDSAFEDNFGLRPVMAQYETLFEKVLDGLLL